MDKEPLQQVINVKKLNSDKDTVHLFATNKEVAERNANCIKNLNEPIVFIQAEHSGQGSKLFSNNSTSLKSKAYFVLQKFFWRRIFINKQDYVMVPLARWWLFYLIGMSLP